LSVHPLVSLSPVRAEALVALGRPELVPARVVAAAAGRWRVLTSQGELLAEPTGRLRFDAVTAADLPTVGDLVAVAARPDEGRATVVAVLPRTSVLVRKAAGRAVAPQPVAANVDVVLLACGLDADWNPRRLERFLAFAWDSGASPVVVLTKADLAPDLAARLDEAAHVAVGAAVVAVAAPTGLGLDALRAHLPAGALAAIVGSSGVGKSTLLNALLGRAAQDTGPVRAHDGRGLHTTTARELFAMPWGAYLVDTPGVREIAVWTDAAAVAAAFDDVAALAPRCRFRDCAHATEPGCAVLAAVADGTLDAGRLEDYRHLLREQAFLARKADPVAARAERARWKQIGRAGRDAMRRKRGE
jgi:ribosome biogenesis GTPase